MWAKHCRSTIGKMVGAFAFAVVISGIAITPALSQENYRRQDNWARQDNRERHENQRRYGRERPWQDERVRREQSWQERHNRRVYPSYRYSTPIYTPPSVVYPPYPSPGINLFFPFHFR